MAVGSSGWCSVSSYSFAIAFACGMFSLQYTLGKELVIPTDLEYASPALRAGRYGLKVISLPFTLAVAGRPCRSAFQSSDAVTESLRSTPELDVSKSFSSTGFKGVSNPGDVTSRFVYVNETAVV